MVGPDYQYITGDGGYSLPGTLAAGLMTNSSIYTEQDWVNLQGLVAFTPNDIGNNSQYQALNSWFLANYNTSVPRKGATHYDCVISFAYTLSNVSGE